jgi:hypothetical protein
VGSAEVFAGVAGKFGPRAKYVFNIYHPGIGGFKSPCMMRLPAGF